MPQDFVCHWFKGGKRYCCVRLPHQPGPACHLDQDRAALSGPTSVALDEILYHNAYDAEARIYWDAVDGAASYEIYKVNANGTSNLITGDPQHGPSTCLPWFVDLTKTT